MFKRLVELKTENEKLKRENAELQRQFQAAEVTKPADSELQRELNVAIQQLLTVKDKLTVGLSERVTAVTQRRQLVQKGYFRSRRPQTTSDYEELRFDSTQEPAYAQLQLTTHTG